MTFPTIKFYPLVLQKSIIIEMKLLYIFSFTQFKLIKYKKRIKEEKRKQEAVEKA